MRISNKKLGDVVRYIKNHEHIKISDKIAEFDDLMARISCFKDVGPETKMLEIGTGIGWLLIISKMKGLSCKGIEISPDLVEFGRQLGRENKVEPDIELGNIEECDIGESAYDVVFALSSFEHVERWQEGLRKVYRALKPGGVFYFTSTNKFSLSSGEYSFPLYGWLPNSVRYRLRKARQGPDIMELGIDYNQFTYFQLRRFFRRLGFSRVYDRVDIYQTAGFRRPSVSKRWLLKIAKCSGVLRNLMLLFDGTTYFICVK